MNIFKKFYCVKQHDTTDCGAACIATISKQYGLKIPISKIREIAGTDKQGTNALGLIKAAQSLNFSAKGVKGDQEAFFSGFPLPAIAHIVTDEGMLHYVVIHKIEKEVVTIADPAKGLIKIKPEEFFKKWTGILLILVPNPSFEEGDSTNNTFSRFLSLLRPQKRLLVHIFFASIVYTLLGIMAAFYFKVLIDDILPYSLGKTLWVVSLGIIILNIFKIILNTFRMHLMLYLSQKIDIPLVLGYYNHVIDLPMSFYGSRKVGEIISRFMDASKIREAISSATLSIMIDTLMAIVGGIILYSYNSTLFSIALAMLLLYAFIVFGFNKIIYKTNRTIMEENSQLTSYLVESLSGIETVKTYNFQENTKNRTETKFVKLLKTSFKMGMINNFQKALTTSIASIGGVAILWVGSLSVMDGRLSIGQLLVFNSLLAYFIDPVKNLINLQPIMQRAIAASDRLAEILDLELEEIADSKGKLSPESLIGDICFKDIDFRYGTRKLVLENINLKIRQGQQIALVGESGSGKTTLVKLLLGLYIPENGEILIDKHNIKDINLKSLRDKIAYVSQDTFLFSGTIEENLKLGNNMATMEEVISCCQKVKLHDFINELPLRYQTRLDENGANLSGGQRQRLSIARALLKKPDILILDEATSNLDALTETAISNTIDNLSFNITTIIIAHRLSTIRKCDQIFILNGGRLAEFGDHSELVLKKSAYYKMWQSQIGAEALGGIS